MNGRRARDLAGSFTSAIRSWKSCSSHPSSALELPMVDLGALLLATRSGWQQNLNQLFGSMQFILGEQVAAFEREFAMHMRAKHAVGVGTGTAALELCLRATDITHREQQVITSALTSPFTAQAIRSAGATPVFADVDSERLLMDPDHAASRITSRTAAVLPVHLYGQACSLDRLRAISRHAAIALVQDACQAHGATFQGRPLAHFSPWIAYSFYPTKNLGCLGDAGAVIVGSSKMAAKVRMLRDGGRRKDQISRVAGMNSRLDEMQACFLRAFLPKLTDWNARRAHLAALYDEALSACDAVQPVKRSAESVNHLYVIRTGRREKLRAHLAHLGIGSAVHYTVPLHLHPAFADCGLKNGALPNAERACREVLSLPLWPHLPESAVLFIAEAVSRFFAGRTPVSAQIDLQCVQRALQLKRLTKRIHVGKERGSFV